MSAQPDYYPGMDDFARFDERLPPCSIEAEQAVLGGLMLSPESLAKVSDWLTADDFFRRDHQAIYRAILGLSAQKSPCDAITMGDWFVANDLGHMIDGPTYLMELANGTPSAANIVAYGEIVVEKSRLRRASDVGAALMQAANRTTAASDMVIGEAVHQLSSMHASKLRGGLESAVPALKRMQEQMFARYDAAESDKGMRLLGLPWPWRELNRATKGLRAGVLYVVGARPNMGKSVFGGQTAVFTALSKKNVAWFSVEMTAEECMARAVAAQAQIPHDWVESPTPHDPDAESYWPRLTSAVTMLIDAPLHIDETPGINIDQLMARARRAHMQRPLDLIVIDHMHDMGIDEKKEVRHEYGRITQGAKTLAKELGCPVILMAQLNRASAQRPNKRPTMTDLRESGEIEQKADVILFLHRDDYYDPKSPRKGIVDVILAKGRNIRTGDNVELLNCFSEMRLKDLDEWDRPEPIADNIAPYMPRGFKG
ncbi:replicative DNA helicase [Luteibacter flocculans]|uniref:DNA 5'-3' helicase n=1 Tax=Luteibacter flocculans TaxID=2780091 RepID=A0ABY4T4T5_9GAMM|nr:replicative DNA helicase [Luteibacter flocculans]URL59601.1 replicative DNA helicase [Luteibacter flocculans]